MEEHIVSAVNTPTNMKNSYNQFATLNRLVKNKNKILAKRLLKTLHHADLADYLNKSPYSARKFVIKILGGSFPADALIWIDPAVRPGIVKIFGFKKIAKILSHLDTEDIIEFFEGLPQITKEEVISFLSSSKQREIREGFTYPEHCAGRIMEKDFIAFSESWTVGEAISYIQESKYHSKDFYAAIVVDYKNNPVGNILISTLLKYSSAMPIKKIMNQNLKIADTHTSEENLVFTFKHYGLTIVPVVNKKGVLVGTVTLNNMIYIIEEHAEQDIMQLSGVSSTDIYSRLFSTVTHRFPWLFVNLFTAYLTSIIISMFESTIQTIVKLAFIMPIVASMGGNAGTQTVTVAVRGISTKEITNANALRVIGKEICVSTINGLMLGSIGAIFIYLLFSDMEISFVFMAAVLVNFFAAGFLGSAIPIILHKINVDPAVASGVFLTALTDAIGFFVFLSFAYMVLIR